MPRPPPSTLPETPEPIRNRPVVTLREVAEQAGVSMITVSRAINTPGQVSEPVRLEDGWHILFYRELIESIEQTQVQ